MSTAGTNLINPADIFERIKLGPGMRVADLGCGRTGHFVFPASTIVEDIGIVYAVDILKETLESIKSRIRSEGRDNIQVVWSDIEVFDKTPIPETSLDVCFFVNVLSQLKNRQSAMRESARFLKSGGLLVIIDWQNRIGSLGPSVDKMLSKIGLQDDVANLGMDLVDNFAAGDYHFCLVFRKK